MPVPINSVSRLAVAPSTNSSGEAPAATPAPKPRASALELSAGGVLIGGGLSAAWLAAKHATGLLHSGGIAGGIVAAIAGVGLIAHAFFSTPSSPSVTPTPTSTPQPTEGTPPTTTTPTPTPSDTSTSPTPTPTPTTPPVATTIVHIAQLNAHNLFDLVNDPHHQDDIPTAADHDVHLSKLALALRDDMHAPDVVTMQEVENQQVLDELLARPELAGLGYRGVVLEGTDPRGIDNAIIWREPHVHLTSTSQLDPRIASATGRQVHLYTRPPLIATFDVAAGASALGTSPTGDGTGTSGTSDAAAGAHHLTVAAAHFTSKLGGSDAAARRALQAGALGDWYDAQHAADPTADIVVAGDLNMSNTEPEFAPLVTHADGTPRALTQLSASVDEAARYSWGRASQRQLLDHVLVSPSLAAGARDVTILHTNSGASRAELADPTTGHGASDHDPTLATLTLGRATQ